MFLKKKRNPIEQSEMPEVISFQEIFNKVKNITEAEIDENTLRDILKAKGLSQEIVTLEDIEKIYNNIENDHLTKIVKIGENGTQEKYIRVATDSKDIATIINNTLGTQYSVDQYGPANGGGILFHDNTPAKITKNHLVNLISFKLKWLIDEKNEENKQKNKNEENEQNI